MLLRDRRLETVRDMELNELIFWRFINMSLKAIK